VAQTEVLVCTNLVLTSYIETGMAIIESNHCGITATTACVKFTGTV